MSILKYVFILLFWYINVSFFDRKILRFGHHYRFFMRHLFDAHVFLTNQITFLFFLLWMVQRRLKKRKTDNTNSQGRILIQISIYLNFNSRTELEVNVGIWHTVKRRKGLKFFSSLLVYSFMSFSLQKIFSCIFYSASDFSTFVKFAYVWDLVIKKIAILSKNVSSNISKSTSDIKRAKTYDIKHTELS